MITIAIADDSAIVRHNMCALLEMEPDLRIVGEAADGLEAVRLVKRLKPNVLVVDLTIDGMNGIEIIKRVGKCSPETSVVVFSMHADEAYVDKSLQAGAKAYVVKESISGELVHAIQEAAAGHRYLSPPFSEKSIEKTYKGKI
jgi:two-component system response regulator NreC